MRTRRMGSLRPARAALLSAAVTYAPGARVLGQASHVAGRAQAIEQIGSNITGFRRPGSMRRPSRRSRRRCRSRASPCAKRSFTQREGLVEFVTPSAAGLRVRPEAPGGGL